MGRWEITHEKLRRAGLELFVERGYEATSTAQIARRAGVSEMTLFRHFRSKDTLLLDDPFDPLMAEAVCERPVDETAMQALTAGVRETWADIGAEEASALRVALKLIAQTPVLRGAIERNSAATVDALVDALSERGVPEARARVAASAVIAGLSAALLDWAQSDDVELGHALGSALDVLGGE